MSDSANPETGVHDVESAVKYLTQPEEAKEEDTEAVEATEEEAPPEEAAESEEAEEAEPEETTDDEAEEDESEEEEPEEPTYTVKVNGEEFEVTLEELRSGYQMGRDYHRKTASLAEERRAFDAERQQVQQMREQLTDALDRFAAQGEQQEPDWVKLADELDPWEYQKKRAEWDRTRQARDVAAQRAQMMRAEDHQKLVLDQSKKLLETFPEWKEPKAFERDRDAMLSAAQSYGFSPQEFYGAVDHRVFRLLRDAMRGKEFADAKPAPQKRVPKKPVKALRPGAKQTKSEAVQDRQRALKDNLRRKGTTDAAVEWLLGG